MVVYRLDTYDGDLSFSNRFTGEDRLTLDTADAAARTAVGAVELPGGRLAALDARGGVAVLLGEPAPPDRPQYRPAPLPLRTLCHFNAGGRGARLRRGSMGAAPSEAHLGGGLVAAPGAVAVTAGGGAVELQPLQPAPGRGERAGVALAEQLVALQRALAQHPATRPVGCGAAHADFRGVPLHPDTGRPLAVFRHPPPAPPAEGAPPPAAPAVQVEGEAQAAELAQRLQQLEPPPPPLAGWAAPEQRGAVLDGDLLARFMEAPLAAQREIAAAAGLPGDPDRAAADMGRSLGDLLLL